ncbi:MAG: S8 family serine peptidase [Oscillatoria sp. SIO1A7]|nr:S8 family serine peptidase [Oscillatoria sp. SIO1A7]
MSEVQIGALSGGHSYSDSVGLSLPYDDDTYNFGLDERSSLSLSLIPGSGSVDWSLADSGGNVVESGSASSDLSSQIIKLYGLAADQYSLEVSYTGEDTDYDFGIDRITGLEANSGYFTALDDQISVNFISDGGAYKGEVGLFNLEGMHLYKPDSEAFFKEAARRSLSGSYLGDVSVKDSIDKGQFDINYPWDGNHNFGTYAGFRTFDVNPGDKFGIIMVPNGTMQEVFDNPAIGGNKRPLFSLGDSNPNGAFHVGQLAAAGGNIFVMEDKRVDLGTDRDYNDIVIYVKGAKGEAVSLDDVVHPDRDIRDLPEWQDVEKTVNTAPEFVDGFPKIDTTGGNINIAGRVYDEDGGDDLQRIRVWSRVEGTGDWGDFEEITSFSLVSSDYRWANFEYSLAESLEPGNYELKLAAYDTLGASSQEVTKAFRINAAPTDLQFAIPNNPYKPGDNIAISGGKVFDADGINDLDKVEFFFRKDSGTWQAIADVTNFTAGDDGSANFNFSWTAPEAGDYELRAVAQDLAGGTSNEVIKTVAIAVPNTAPTDLQFAIPNNPYNPGDNIAISGGKVFDADGINDLDKVEFSFREGDGDWQAILNVTDFTAGDDGSANFDFSWTAPEAGSYELRATAYDQAQATSNQVVQTVAIATPNTAPTDLQFTIPDDSSLKAGETVTVTVTGGKVSDADGVEDLEKVEFFLRNSNDPEEPGQKVGEVTEFTGSNGQASFADLNLDLTVPDEGDYELRAVASDQAGSTTEFVVQTVPALPGGPLPAPPENLQFTTQRFYASDDVVEISSGRVYDLNGVDDLKEVDFELRYNGGDWQDISDVTSFDPTDEQNWATFEYQIDESLVPGRYELRGVARDKSSDPQDNESDFYSQSFTVLSLQGGDGLSDRVRYAIDRATNLSSYSEAQLESTDRWVVSVQSGGSAEALAQSIGAQNLGSTGHIPNTFTWEFADDADPTQELASLAAVEYFYPLLPFGFSSQGTSNGNGGAAGANLNIQSVWDDSIFGTGVTIAIVDDGVQGDHPNFADRYRPDLSRDFNLGSGGLSGHGTAMALLAAGNDGAGVAGAAPNAFLAGLRLTAEQVEDLQIADALSYLNGDIDIYSNSWGGTYWLDLPQSEFALEAGANNGRDGLGSIFVFAGGNDGAAGSRPQELSSSSEWEGQNVNYNNFANSRHSIAVAAIGSDGVRAEYSQSGAPLLVSAYEGNAGDWNTGGATALVSGVVALMLEANPALTWRDVQHILVGTADRNGVQDANPAWSGQDGDAIRHSHKYGFGAIDAGAAVNAARTWIPVEPEVAVRSGEESIGEAISDNGSFASTISIDEDVTVESVEVMFKATGDRSQNPTWNLDYRSDLKIVLTSPDGTESVLAQPHREDWTDDPESDQFDKWVFTSLRHWGKSSVGDWKLEVFDEMGNQVTGTWDSWQISLFGTSTLSVQTSQDAAEGGNNGEFVITRSGNTSNPLAVSFDITGTAAATDYQLLDENGNPLSGSVTIPAGQKSAKVVVQAVDDALSEVSETVELSLQSSDAYPLGSKSSAVLKIVDNDPTVTIRAIADGAEAGPSPAQFRITREKGDLSAPLDVNISATGGTAQAGVDYEALSQTVRIEADETSAIVTLNPIDDTEIEGNETVQVSLVTPESGSYIVGSASSASATIEDNEKPEVTLTVVDDDLGEENNPGQLQVTRNGNFAGPLVVQYTLGGTATNGTDYEDDNDGRLTGTVTIPAGQASAVINISPTLDDLAEGDETIEFDLAASAAYELDASNSSADLVIKDKPVPGPHSMTHASSYTYIEDTALTLNNPPIAIVDPDGEVTSVTVTLSNRNAGALSSNVNNGATSSFNSSNGVWQASGSVADVNALLAGLEFTPANDFNANLSLLVRVADDISASLSGNILLRGTAVNDVPTLEQTTLEGAVENSPYTITYENLRSATNAEDVDRDSISFQIDSVESGKLVKVAADGTETVIDGTSPINLAAGEELVWTPDRSGDAVEAFTIRAFDGTAYSDPPTSIFVQCWEETDFHWDAFWPNPGGGGPGGPVAYEAVDTAFDGQGNIYTTAWSHPGDPTNGNVAYLLKYNPSGALQWAASLGTSSHDDSLGIDVDSQDRIYITGSTEGDLGGPNEGGKDVWVAKYDGSGSQEWVRQFGTGGDDVSGGLVVSPADEIYISGTTTGALSGPNNGGEDVFLAKFNDGGTLQYLDQLGTTSNDSASGVAVDGAGNVYVSGTTEGSFGGSHQGGVEDAFLLKYEDNGAALNHQWTEQIGTNQDDFSAGVAVDGNGNAYIAGGTSGYFGSGSNPNATIDTWLAKYSSDTTSPNQEWIEQVGTVEDDVPTDVAVDRQLSKIYVSVKSDGDFDPSQPPPASSWLLGFESSVGHHFLSERLHNPNVEGIDLKAGETSPGFPFSVDVAATGDLDDNSRIWTAKYSIQCICENVSATAALPGPQTYQEDTLYSLAPIVVADPDDGNTIVASLTLPSGVGTLSTSTAGAAGSTFNPTTGVWRASGSLADVNALLAGVQFNPANNYSGSINIGLEVTDLIGDTFAGNIVLNGNPQDDIPEIVSLPSGGEYVEGTPYSLSPLEISDPDGEAQITVSLADPSAGSLRYQSNVNASLTLGGSVAALNNALGSLEFVPAANYSGDATINVTVAHATNPATGTIALTGQAVNDAPTLGSISIPTPATNQKPFTITYEQLAANASDPEGDAITLNIGNVLSGTLTKGGADATGQTLIAGESVVWTPDTAGSSVPAFEVQAVDSLNAASASVNVALSVVNESEVAISTTQGIASEFGETGEFTLSRSATDTSKALTVTYSLGGSADVGSDYTLSGVGPNNTITIPAKQSQVKVIVTPVSDSEAEENETVILNLTANPGSNYDLGANASAQLTIEELWIEQLGTSNTDEAKAIATDNLGNIYVAGRTSGQLGAGANQGIFDVWLAKYDSARNLLWSNPVQFGTPENEEATGIAVDDSGNVYITGWTEGSLGVANKGDRDPWVAAYNPDGAQLWLQQIDSESSNVANDIAVYNDNGQTQVYITGSTEGELENPAPVSYSRRKDAWVAKYNGGNGQQQWLKQLGSEASASDFDNDEAHGVATDSLGNVYITGFTSGGFGGSNKGGADAWLAKYDSNGNSVWSPKQLGTAVEDKAFSIAISSNDKVYIAGTTRGNLAGPATLLGQQDAWVARYSSDGALESSKQLGTAQFDDLTGIAVDAEGNFHVAGKTRGSLGGVNQGSFDAWLAKYDGSSLGLLKEEQVGTSTADAANDIAVDNSDYVYVAGETFGDLEEENQGSSDAWVGKFLA